MRNVSCQSFGSTATVVALAEQVQPSSAPPAVPQREDIAASPMRPQAPGNSSDTFDLAQAARHEWAGLRAWRAKGRDLRLVWAPPDSAAGPLTVSPSDAPSLVSAVPPGADPPSSLVAAGLLVLRTPDPEVKAALTHAAWGAYLVGELPLRDPGAPDRAQQQLQREGGATAVEPAQQAAGEERAGGVAAAAAVAVAAVGTEAEGGERGLAGLMPEHPARPERPRLVRPKEIPGHESSPLGLNGYMLHNLAHIELNAIDLAWDTVVRFSHLNLPDQFYEDFARVADDESRHLGWCLQRLGELGHSYGDMDAHDLLWQGCSLSGGDLGARLAVVPMSQEARGLDAGSRLVQRLVGWGDTRSAAVVGLIAEEERAHVAVGVTWFSRLCGALGLQPGPLYRRWLLHLNPDLLKGPFNHPERARVGLPRDWYDPTAWQLPAAGGGGRGGGTGPGPAQAQAQAQRQPAENAAAQDAGAAAGTETGAAAAPKAATAVAVAMPGGDSGGSAWPEGGRGAGDGAVSGAGAAAAAAVGAARRPVRGAPHPRLEGPQPRLSAEQLAALAERLAAFTGVEGAAACRR